MLLAISNDLFNDRNSFDYLDSFFKLVEKGMHELVLEDEQENAIMDSQWLESLGERHKSSIQEFLEKTLVQNQYLPNSGRKLSKIKIELREDIAKIINCLKEPFHIVVEDIESDGKFIKSLCSIYRNASKKIRKWMDNGWLRITHAGGKSHIPKVIIEYFLQRNDLLYLRLYSMIDSDKHFLSQAYSTEINNIQAFCVDNNIPLHILYKRETENYLPEIVIKKMLPIELENVFSAYDSLNSEQKDFFDLEKGFDGKRTSLPIYQNLREETHNLLREGFNKGNQIRVKHSFHTWFEEEECSQAMLELRCAHQPNINELKNFLSDLSNAL